VSEYDVEQTVAVGEVLLLLLLVLMEQQVHQDCILGFHELVEFLEESEAGH
jgi:hypothetical protein